jgi:hypothetical protein
LNEPKEYKIQEGFTLEFIKWGITSPLNSKSEEDISKIFNDTKKNNTSAKVDSKMPVSNSPLNGFYLFS